jgi:hypothetical protein
MPYRRIPNTDAARIRAMKIAHETGKELPPQKLAFSAKTLIRLQRIFPLFENGIHQKKQSVNARSSKSQSLLDTEKKARIYVTHFIRVMNMAILRGELPAETRAYYGLGINDSTVPMMNTQNELISWGKRIIDGEEFRIRKGGNPITNPTIAVVKVRFEKYLDALLFSQTLNKKTGDFARDNVALRKEADETIISVWNEVEAHFVSLNEEEKRKECEKYGIVYFFRKNEKKKAENSTEILLEENRVVAVE